MESWIPSPCLTWWAFWKSASISCSRLKNLCRRISARRQRLPRLRIVSARQHERRADVLIVGGGPAGSTAAFGLAKRGYDVLLIDKAHHPRETVGESILPSAWKYFDLLGVSEAIKRDGYVKKAGGVVVWGDQ